MKTLVTDKEDKHNLNILEGMKPLLTKFDEIIPNELLGRLPSMRDIKHQINLISGASLPNPPHYKMSSKKR